jgi:trigger factor
MQVKVENLDPCKVQFTIEVEPEKVAEAIDDVYKEYRDGMSVPGFRKGKTPRKILERVVSPEKIKERAIELLISPAYFDAIKQEDVHPYADPSIDIVEYEPGKPFIFKADIPLPPQVELGEYKGIEVERRKVEVTDEDVDNQVKYLQESRATSEKVEDRGIENGDIVVADISSKLEGGEKEGPKRSMVQVGSNIPGFDEAINGLKAGEMKTFSIKYPDDFVEKENAGKMVEFEFTVESIRKRNIPELNEDFLKSVGNFETVEALREDIKKHLVDSAEQAADREVEHKIIDEIVNRSKVSFPDVMVDHEIHHDLHDLHDRLAKQGHTVESYLRQIGKTEEDLIAELRTEAEQRLKIGLVLGDVAEAEKIEVTDADIDAEIDRIAADSKTPRASVEAFLETRGGRASLKNTMYNQKITELLRSISVINGAEVGS